MSEKTLEDKAVEILDASQQALGAFAEKLAELAKQYGPDVMDAALQMARIEAAQKLIWSVCALVGGAAIAYFSNWFWKKAKADPYAVWEIPGALTALVSAALIFVGGAGLTNIWTWVGIFEPKLWIARRILGL